MKAKLQWHIFPENNRDSLPVERFVFVTLRTKIKVSQLFRYN